MPPPSTPPSLLAGQGQIYLTMGTPWLLTLSLLRNIRDLVVIMQSAHSKSKAGFTPQPPPKTADQKTLEDKTRISMEQCLTPVYPHGRLKEYFKYPAHSILKLMSLAETSPGFETSAYGVIQAVLSTTFNPSDRGWVVKPQPRLVSRNQVQTVYEQLFRADASDGDPSDETFPDLEADKDDWFVDGDTSYNEIIIEEGM